MANKSLHSTKDGFRYHWGEDDVVLCKEYIREYNAIDQKLKAHSNQTNVIPVWFKARESQTSIKWSDNDKAPQLRLSEMCTRVMGEKGYSMARATHCINRGKFYYEVYIDSMPENTAARIGWGQSYANLQAPLGYDYYGYSWRSRLGTKFHQAQGKTFDKGGGYGQGHTIGCMIEIPYDNPRKHTHYKDLPKSIKDAPNAVLPNSGRKKDSNGRCQIEEKLVPPKKDEMGIFPGSKISFYKNGRFIGVAFEDIYQGFYHPTVSLYKSCLITANFGPHFKYPPEKYNPNSKNHIGYQPASDMVELSIIDNIMADLIFVVEKENGENGVNHLQDSLKVSPQN